MAYATKAFNLVQLGRETTAGTPVAATKKWRGSAATAEDARERKTVEEDVGLLVPSERSYDLMELARLSLPSTEFTFEQICDLFEMGIGAVSPSGAGPYVRDYAFPTTTAANTIKSYTVEVGNTQVPDDVHEIPFTYAEEIQLSGKKGEGWMMQANLVGQKLSQTGFTSSLPLITVTEAPFMKTKLWLDATGGTIGTTQKLGTLMACDIRIQTGIKFIPVGDGTLNYTAIKYTRPAVDFKLTIEVESGGQAAALRTAYKTNVIQLARVQLNADANHTANFDLAVKWDKVNPYDEDDGNVTMTLDGHAVYSPADTLFFEASITNQIATL